MTTTNLIINQKTKTEEGLVISGVVTTNKKDRQHETITISPNALKKAWPEFSKGGAPMKVEHALFARFDGRGVSYNEKFNPREHYWLNPAFKDRTVGKVLNMEFENPENFDIDTDEPKPTKITFVALIADPEAIEAIENNELDSVSLGWSSNDWYGRQGQPTERVDTDITIKELSLTANPANPDALIEKFHRVTDEELERQFFPKGELVATKNQVGRVEDYFRDDWGEIYVKLSNHKSLVKVEKVQKSEAQTPAEPDERIEGSDKNPEGSASTESEVDIELSEATEKALEKKVEEHNEQYPDKKVTKRQLEKVWRRGAGAFSASHRPGQSRSSWAMARVNTFLDMVAGKDVKDSYREADGDLLSNKNNLLESLKAMTEYNKACRRKKAVKALLSRKKSFEEERDEVFKKYHELVNMSASELEEWSKNPKSRLASLSREPITRNLRLLRKKKEDWTKEDVRDAKRTISYISRAEPKGVGVVTEESKPFGRNEIALRNWACRL